MPQQFSNPANPDVHRRTTAEEIWRDTGGEIDALVCGVGTGGTITGVGQVLKDRRPGFQLLRRRAARIPRPERRRAGPHKIQGIGAGFVPDVLDAPSSTRRSRSPTRMRLEMARDVAAREGLLVGISAGAAIAAPLDVAARPEMKGKRIVTIACDGGERYMSLPFFAGPERYRRLRRCIRPALGKHASSRSGGRSSRIVLPTTSAAPSCSALCPRSTDARGRSTSPPRRLCHRSRPAPPGSRIRWGRHRDVQEQQIGRDPLHIATTFLDD